MGLVHRKTRTFYILFFFGGLSITSIFTLFMYDYVFDLQARLKNFLKIEVSFPYLAS